MPWASLLSTGETCSLTAQRVVCTQKGLKKKKKNWEAYHWYLKITNNTFLRSCARLSKPTFSNFHSSAQQKSPAVLKHDMGYYQNNSPCLRKGNHQPWYFTEWVSFYTLENGQTSKRTSCIVSVLIYLYDRRDTLWTDFFFLHLTTPICTLRFFHGF